MTNWIITNVPDELSRQFDEAIKRQYPTRSEAIRDLVRKYLEKAGANQQ